MSADPNADFDWAIRLQQWCDLARLEAFTPARARAERFRSGPYAEDDVNDAVDWAINEACIDQRRQTPWYFPTETCFVRWVIVMASRRLAGVGTTRRIVLPLLEYALGQPCASMIAFWRCDSFRAQDLVEVFGLPRAVVGQRLQECMNRWNALFCT